MPGALAAMVAYADAHPDIGILGPKLYNGDGSLQYSCRRFPNLAHGFFRNTPLGRLLPKNKFASDYLMQDFDYAAPRDVDWVSGAALMILKAQSRALPPGRGTHVRSAPTFSAVSQKLRTQSMIYPAMMRMMRNLIDGLNFFYKPL